VAPSRATSAQPSAQDRADILACDVPALLRARYRIAAAVPLAADRLWEDALALALQQADSADPAQLQLGLSLVALLPPLVLRHLPSGRLPGNLVCHRLHRFLRGDWRHLAEEAWHEACTAPPPGAAAAAAGAPVDAETRLQRQGRRAADFAKSGEFSRAVAVLSSNDVLAPITPATVAQLHSLHPDEEGFDGQDLDADYIAELRALQPGSPLTITEADVLLAMGKTSVKSAGGPSGLTANHLRSAFLRDTHSLSKLLAAVFTRLVNGAGDTDAVAALLGACRLIPLLKPAGGIRPIAVGEILRRICGRILLQQHAGAARQALEPLQVGVGTRNGGIALFHAASTYLAANPDQVLLNIDLRNAFNRMSRVAIYERLRADPQLRDLVPYTRLFYLREGDMLVRDGSTEPPVVKSKTGSQQGCTFGSLLWSVGWQDALEGFA
jgi:hypothetical protein